MTERERTLAAVEQKQTDIPAVGNAVSIATIDLMDATGCSFPEAHLDAETMAGLAAAGYDRCNMRRTRWAARWTGAGGI